MTLIAELTRRLAAKKTSPRAASLAAGLNDTYARDVISGKSKSPTADKLTKLATVLDCTLADLLGDAASRLPQSNAVPALGAPPLPAFSTMPRDLLVFGTAQGGPDGELEWSGDSSMAVDRVPRPPGLAGSRAAFALYTVGDSMAPWRFPGQLIFVHPDRAPQIGGHVVVILKAAADGEPRRALVKTLVERRNGTVILSQYNPAKRIEIKVNEIEHVWRVIEWEDAMGIGR